MIWAEYLLLMETGRQDISEFSLSTRDLEVLKVIEEEDLTTFSFGGIKRRLRMHPETLSRILSKLEDQGILEKGFDGYTVTHRAKGAFGSHPLSAKQIGVSLLQSLLPPDLPAERIVTELRGTWFGMLRWLGHSESEEGITMKWITDDGTVQVDARLLGEELNLEAKLFSEEELSRAWEACVQLMSHVSKICARTGRPNGTSNYGILDSHLQLG